VITLLIEKITAEKLVPVFDLHSHGEMEKTDPIKRDQLFPQNHRLFTLFHNTKSAKLLIATDFEGFDATKTFTDMLLKLSPKRAKSICYIEDVTKVGSAYAFEIWRDKTALFEQLLKQVIVTGKLTQSQINECLVQSPAAISNLMPLLLNLNEFNIEHAFTILASDETKQTPLITASNLCQSRLFGHIDTLYKNNSYTSNAAQIIPGLLHQAHGGYLLINIDDLLNNPDLWHMLKTVVKHNLAPWPSSRHAIQTELKPQPAPVDVKVILLGDRFAISQLSELDRELSDITDSYIDFFPEFNVSKQDIKNYLGYIQLLLEEQRLLPLSKSAIARLLQLSSRWCEHNNYLSLNEAKLTHLLAYCDQYATDHGDSDITLDTLNSVLKLQHEALNSQILLSNESIIEKQLILETSGSKIGQINGLSVLEMDGHPESFGEPVRITATAHLNGDGDVFDVERKAELAGNIHAKAMMIIQGFLTHTFAKPIPLPLSANLVFEQSYTEIDGDSAALAGSCALLSALAKKPIVQHLAVTGAIDQFGNVLAVGGINEKLEGFHRICGLNQHDNVGVLIPAANIVNLNLNKALIEAVNSNQFSIYPIQHIDQAIELLMGIKAGSVEDEESIYGIIHQLAEPEEDNSFSIVNKIKHLYAKITLKHGSYN
jgi:Lon-like ATP-dependent protease